MIVDGHPVHRARKVTAWVHAQKAEVRLIFLPDHSPDLNPDEMLNQDVRRTPEGGDAGRARKRR